MANDGLLNFNNVSVVPGEHIERWAYDGNNQLQYYGYAEKGIETSETKWIISKFTYSSGLAVSKLIAKNVSWDGRASATYS